jgi:hypothetical protein
MSQRIQNPVGSSSLQESRPYRVAPIACIIIAFILSRFLFFHVGIHFDTSTLHSAWQFLDVNLLRHNLLQSVYYLHGQPPLFNLFLGAILKIFPNNEVIVFHSTYLILGLTIALSMFFTMDRLGIPFRVSVPLAILFMVSPSCILYENWLFYTYPVTAFLCLSALFLHRFMSSGNKRDGLIFFTLLSLCVLARGLFHIVWFIFFVLLLLFYQRRHWRSVVYSFCIPLLAILLLYAKNNYVFGSLTTSTWLGMHMSRMTTFRLSEDERRLLVSQGRISELSLIPAFGPLKAYQTNLSKVQVTDIPALDQDVKSTGGINCNNISYIDISRRYLSDAIYVLMSHPIAYLKGLLRAYFFYFLPASDCHTLQDNSKDIRYIERFYDIVFYGRLLHHSRPALEAFYREGNYTALLFNMGLFMVIGLPFLVFFGLRLAKNALWKGSTDLPFALTILFLCTNVIYVTLIGNSVEYGENNRFRFTIDPFFIIILGLFLTHVFKKVKQRAPLRDTMSL